MNIFFDLDGTLLDSRRRLFELFVYLAPDVKISFEQYWELKRNKVSNFDILRKYAKADDGRVDFFRDRWMALIEEDEYLSLDTPFPGVEKFLFKLASQAKLYVCTARQFEVRAFNQLNKLNLFDYFEGVFVTNQKINKSELLFGNVKNISEVDWIIGDTGKDIQTGSALGIHTCAVTSGFLSKDSLTHYGPERIIDVVTDFVLPLNV